VDVLFTDINLRGEKRGDVPSFVELGGPSAAC
jgi:hypothetical protein